MNNKLRSRLHWVLVPGHASLLGMISQDVSVQKCPRPYMSVVHAFTGCGTVSCFAGQGEKTAFAIWKSTTQQLQVPSWSWQLLPSVWAKSASATWNAWWSSCVTEPAPKFMSTMQGSSCLLRKAERLMIFLPLRHHYWRTLREPPIRQVTAGVRCSLPVCYSLPLASGDGFRRREDGNRSGHRSLKLSGSVESSCDVVARSQIVEQNVRVPKQF